MARVGRISVSCDYGDGNPYVVPYRITEIESAGKTFVGIVSEETGQTGMTWYDDVDLSNTTHLDKMFNLGGINTYTWTEAMTEVPDDEVAIEYPISIANGGTGATTATQALTNLGAASATALDALSDTVAGKADASHTHTGYATTSDIDALEDAISDKADTTHTHSEYAVVSHTHDNYATVTALSSLEDVVDGKAESSHTHANYATTTALNELSSTVSGKADAIHTHDYAATTHTHSNYATVTALDELSDVVDGKAASDHTHSNYATVTSVNELQTAVAGKAASSHTHSDYVTVTDFEALEDVVDTKANASHTHDYASTLHTHSNYATVTDLDALSDAVDGKADASHSHVISDIVNLQTTLDGKANVSHTHDYAASSHTHNNYATVADFEALEDAVDTKAAATHSHSDYSLTTHNHDGSYAALDHTHDYATSGHTHSVASTTANGMMSAADKIKLNGIATGAEVNQNAFSNVVVGDVTVTADNKTDSITFAGSNVTVTPDTTNDKITFGITKANVTSALGYTPPTQDTTYSAAGSSLGLVKSGGDVTISGGVITVNDDSHNHTIANVDGLQDALDAKAASGHTHSAYANQNAFSNVVVGSTTIAADSTTDTITLVGSNVTLTPDATNDKVTVSITKDNVTSALGYTPPTSNTTYSEATQSAAGLMSVADKTKLDSVTSGAEPNQNAFSNVTIGSTTITADGKTDTLTFAGSNVTLTPDATNDKVTIGITKANVTSALGYTPPTTNTTYSNATTSSAGLMSAGDKSKLDGVATGAEVNQNAFSNVVVGSTTIAADAKTDSLTLVGSNVTLTPDATNDKVTIGITKSNVTTALGYTPPTKDTTYSVATQSANGLMSANDKTKLDGVATGANNYSLPTATSSVLGGVKTGSNITNTSGTISLTKANVTSALGYTPPTTNTTYSAATTSAAGLMSASDKSKLDGIASGANAYAHPTTAGNKHIPAGGSSGQILRWSADGTAVWGNDNNTTYSNATQSAAGLMSATDKAKLDGIASGANNYTYTLPAAGSSLGGVKTGGDVTISSGTITVNDDSHNHVISNVDGLQAALDGKSATSHNHNSSYISKDLQFTGDNGGVMLSYLKDDGKNILTEFASYPIGFYTVYSQSGTAGNPKTTEAWRFMVHKTGTNTGWVQGYGSIGSVYTNYLDGSSGWRGWKCIWDNDPNPLWSGQYYMSSPNSTPQTVTPSKKLSECRTGWLLLWSDYDAGSGSNDSDFVTTVIPKNDPSGNKWGGKSFLCDIPRYVGSNAEDVDTERRIIKPIYVHDDCIKGSYQNDKDERNDVVLRAVYEI